MAGWSRAAGVLMQDLTPAMCDPGYACPGYALYPAMLC